MARRRAPALHSELVSYFTSKAKLSEWLLNSGAYMHWISAMPVWSPLRTVLRNSGCASLAVTSPAAARRVPQAGQERTGDRVSVERIRGRVDARDRHEAEQRVGDEHLVRPQQLFERDHAFAEAG